MRLTRIPAVSLAALTLLAAPAAAAAQSGVTVDPNSAAGKEYAIPVQRAQRDAGGASGTSGANIGGTSAGDGTVLFGAGITSVASGGDAAHRSGRHSATPVATQRGRQRQTPGAEAGAAAAGRSVAVRALAEPAPSSDELPWLLGTAALVLALGLGVGLAARRR
jgi:hypothetical protein